jgi:hypothetical protein
MNFAPPGGADPFTDSSFPVAPATQPGSVYPPLYGGTPFASHAMPYMPSGFNSTMYGTGHYGSAYGAGAGRYGAMLSGAQSARDGGAAVLSGMQEAMQRFARVSALVEEVLRNLHMLFDAVFGLGYSVGAFHQEASRWLAIKSGPVALVKRALDHVQRLWRLVVLFLCSPMAGRFSPVALVLRVLGVVPEYASFEDADVPGPVPRGQNAETTHAHGQDAFHQEDAFPWPRRGGSSM